MSVIPIYNCFHPILKQKTKKVEEFDQDLKNLVTNMFDTLYNISNGVGLAGNQVGKSMSLFITDLSVGNEKSKPQPMVFINPEIIDYSDDIEESQEGCLSIPEFYEKVKRPKSIQVKYYDLNMKEYEKDLDSFLARVFQHEFDHLHGILIYEKITPLRRALNKSRLNRLQRGDYEIKYPMILPNGTLMQPNYKPD
jgi:peptide deformylase